MDIEEEVKEYLHSVLDSELMKLETVKDVFVDDALVYMREESVKNIKSYMTYLFRILDGLFVLFLMICCFGMLFGVWMLIRKIQQRIIKIYHVVLLIPYGQRTYKELNSLLKI